MEQLSGITVQSRVRYLRVIYAELERLANHFGDIGAIMLDAVLILAVVMVQVTGNDYATQ